MEAKRISDRKSGNLPAFLLSRLPVLISLQMRHVGADGITESTQVVSALEA